MSGWASRGGVPHRWLSRARVEVRERWQRFERVWRRSMQLRVVVSTLALSSVVICVLGMVLQTQITYQLMTCLLYTSDAADE